MKIFLDQDGVLADFKKGCIAAGVTSVDAIPGYYLDKELWTQAQKDSDKQIKKVMAVPGFFRKLEMLPEAYSLWEVAGKMSGSPIVLTARPKEGGDRVAKEKRLWITEHFGAIPDARFICCLRSEKKNHAVSASMKIHPGDSSYEGHKIVMPTWWGEPNVLVDDLEWNCSEWEKAGGIAVHFKNMDQAVKDLKSIIS